MSDEKPFQIDLLKIEDIPQLIECVRRCYGNSYPFKQIYSKSVLEELILNQSMHSVICKDQNAKVIGHGSLTFSGTDNTSPELGKLLVDPQYRGHHIADLLANKLIEVAHNLSLAGFWAECVTNHPYSQAVMASAGGIEVGLLLGDLPATIKMQGENNFTDSRMSLLTYYLPSNQRKPLDIFIPELHADYINTLVSTTKLERIIFTTLNKGNGKTELLTTIDIATLDASMQIKHIGSDFSAAIGAELFKAEKQGLASIYIDLPIGDPAAAFACLELEKHGFFFGSWLANFWRGQDILRLQKIYSPINESEIILAREEGKRTKEYVLSEMRRVS